MENENLSRKIEKGEGIYHVCRGMYFCETAGNIFQKMRKIR